jgi:hypothetical protein
MRELIQIETPSEHACAQPAIRRWEVLEPVSGRWTWMTVFECCEQVAIEPPAEFEEGTRRVKRAA